MQPLARGLRAKGGAVAFANFENEKWPVAESSFAHALATPVVPLANPVELKGVGKSAFLGTLAALSLLFQDINFFFRKVRNLKKKSPAAL